MRRFAPLFCAAVVMLSAPVFAQDPAAPDPVAPEAIAADPPAHVSYVEGTAVLERDGEPDASPTNMPLLAGDRIRTERGRVEILFADGSLLHLDGDTTVDFQSDELVRLLKGRIRLTIPGANREVGYRIDAPSAWVQINQPGEYRVALVRDEVELAVLRGAADLLNDSGRTELRAGERAFSRANAAPSTAYVFNSASWDAFDRWSETRRDQRLGVSTQYLPDEVRPYAASFDQYGSWRYESSYGYVWYPTVSVGWRPYYNGRWASLRPFGWTWIGADPWDWPTHHYGRWGISAGVWFWIPGRSWAPAWVSWAYAPGYVSWCPLGFNNRPVFQINVNVRNRGFDPWRAWTVVPRHRFGTGRVSAVVVSARAIDARTRGSFVAGNRSPGFRGYAVPRAGTAIRVAGTAVPRGSRSPVYTNLAPGASRVGPSGSRIMVGQPRGTAATAAPDGAAAAPRARAVPRGLQAGPAAPRAAASGTTPRAYDRAVPRAPGTESVTPRGAVPDAAGDRPYGAIDRTPSRRVAPRDNRTDGSAPYRTPDRTIDRNGVPLNPYGASRAVPRGDVPRTDAPRFESPRQDSPRFAPPTDAPRAVTPRVDPPSYRRDPGERRGPDQTAPSRAVPRGPDQAAPSRAMPRGPASAAPPSRSNPGADRRAPSQPSGGAARPRGGRGGR